MNQPDAKVIELFPKGKNVELVLTSRRFRFTATLSIQEARELIQQLSDVIEDLDNG